MQMRKTREARRTQSLQSQGDNKREAWKARPMWDAFPLALQLWKSRKQLQPSREQIFAEGGEPCGGEAGTLTWPPHSFSFSSNFIDRTDRSDSAPVTRERIGKLRPAGLAH